jgi:phage/plasmid-like protein (TIGR03299 family)
MAHNLNFNNNAGRHAFVSVKEIAWHGLGKVVPNALTSEECIKEALLNYEVDKAEVFAKYVEPINGKRGVLMPNDYITYRTDTGDAFSIVGKNYEVIQNWEAFKFFDRVVGEKRAIFETAGSLGKGEVIFITAKLPEHFIVGGVDVIDQYLLLTMGHDGTSAITAKFTPIRVVCNNTLSAALNRGGNVFRIRHSSVARDRMKQAEQLLAITYKTSKETQEIYNHLTKIKITDETRDNYLLSMMLSDSEMANLANSQFKWSNSPDIATVKKNRILDLFEYNVRGAGQDLDICKGTAYGAYNALTGYIQNIKSYSSDEKKFSNIMLGVDGSLLTKALNKALELETI